MNRMTGNPDELVVRLLAEEGETSRYIDARIDESGSFVMETQDIGKAPEEFWGDSDYEFWAIVKPTTSRDWSTR